MPSKKPSMIDALRAKHDPHYQLSGKVEDLEKNLPRELNQLHKTLSKSFALQGKTLKRVIGLEKRISTADKGGALVASEAEESEVFAGEGIEEGTRGGINGESFLGADGYEKFADELQQEGTIAGTKLSPQERKEGFKKRNNKIDFQKFVGKVLDKKGTAGGGKKSTPTGGLGAAKTSTSAEKDVDSISKDSEAELDEEGKESRLTKVINFIQNILDPSLTRIEESLGNILGNLEGKVEADKDKAEDIRQSQDAAADDSREAKLESKGKGMVGKSFEKATKPVTNFFSALLKFFVNVILGTIVMRIIKIIEKPMRLLDPLFMLINGISMVINAIHKALWDFWKGPINWISDGLSKGINFLIDGINKALGLLKGIGVDVNIPNIKLPRMGEAAQIPMIPMADARDGVKMKEGGVVPGTGSGDIVPALLEPGEFVMSKGAVEQIGTDNLKEMNAQGGGTNKPRVLGGVTRAQGGGLVGGDTDAVSKGGVGMTAKKGFFGNDAPENRFRGPKNESYFLQVAKDDGRIEIWNEEFGADKFIGTLFPSTGKIKYNNNWWGGARKFEKEFFDKGQTKAMVIGRAKNLEKGFLTDDVLSANPAAIKKSGAPVAVPGPPGSGGTTIMGSGDGPGGGGVTSGTSGEGQGVTPFSAKDIRNYNILVNKGLYNIMG